MLLYGATGFTGALTARYLDAHPELNGKRWAIAGRSADKLSALAAELSSAPGVVACTLTDAEALASMVASARVVITCAGPFSLYDGDKLLGECARQGKHYSDLAGEGWWQREMVQQHHGAAVKSGAKIVLGGGVDSIPSDLGAMMALDALGAAKGDAVTVQGVYVLLLLVLLLVLLLLVVMVLLLLMSLEVV